MDRERCAACGIPASAHDGSCVYALRKHHIESGRKYREKIESLREDLRSCQDGNLNVTNDLSDSLIRIGELEEQLKNVNKAKLSP